MVNVKINGNKSWWKSRTLWIGILEVIAGLTSYASGELALGHSLTVAGALTVIMRFITKETIAGK